MDSTTVGEKIMYIITTILAAAGLTTVVPPPKDQQQDRQPFENNVSQQESSETEVNKEVTNEDSSPASSSVYVLEDDIVIEITPGVNNGKLSSPISIEGTVPNSRSNTRFTIKVTDPSGNVISNNSVSASNSGDSSPASFNTNLKFSTYTGGTGSLEIKSRGDTITIPVEF